MKRSYRSGGGDKEVQAKKASTAARSPISFNAADTENGEQQSEDVAPPPKKVMNVENLKVIVGNDSKIAERSVILSVEVMRGLRSRANVAADIMSVFGKENVECIDFVTQKLILVTLSSDLFLPGDNLKLIQYKPRHANQHQALYYYMHLLHPIKARVEGILTGIPHFISSSQLPLLTEKVTELLPTLSEVTMEYIPWPSTSIMCGDLMVKGITSDVDASYSALLKQTVVPLGDFEGQVVFKILDLVEKSDNDKLPVEEREGVTIHNWYD